MVRDRLVPRLGALSVLRDRVGLNGTWERPAAFPAGVYEALIWPDMFFVPLYAATAALLWRRHWLGNALAFAAAGGIIYAMIYLLALSRLSGAVNVVADSLFLACTLVALWQVGARVRQGTAR